MASLAHCVDLHKTLFSKEEMGALRSESRGLAMEKKITTKEAMIQVVRSRIAETQVEYDKIAGVVRKHYKVPIKPDVRPVAKTIADARVAEKDAAVDLELAETAREERRLANEQKIRDDFYNRAAKKGNAAQASDIIGGGIDRLVDDIEKGRITKEDALSMHRDAVEKGIAIPERLEELERKTEKVKLEVKPTVPEKKASSHIELVKRYVEETGEKVEKGELDKVKARYPVEWATIEKAEAHKKELWNKLPESFRRNRGINEYTTKELEDMVIARKKEKVKFSVAAGPVYVRRGTLTDEVLNRINKYLKSLGYDTRGKQDVYQSLKGRTLEDGTKRKGMMDSKTREIKHQDWADAYERAMKGVEVRKKKLKIKKEVRISMANVDWNRIKELGKTADIREAGYITPEGDLIDLSGKREGGEPGTRSYDHREAGGTLGMQEYVALGNIRMDFSAGTLDILVEPTPAQYKKIDELVRLHRGELVVDLGEGLGEQTDTYYLNPDRTFGNEYPVGTTLSEIKNDIERFYAGEKVKPVARPVLFSRVADMYSALTRAAEAPKFPANISAKSVINQLKKAPGVKQVEIEVSGLAEWLEGKDKILKVELVDFLKMNEVRVEEVEKGVVTPEQIEVRADIFFEEAVDARVERIEEETGEEPDRADVSNEMEYQDVYDAAEEELREEEEVKFAEYVLPGGEPASYRELVLRVPERGRLIYTKENVVPIEPGTDPIASEPNLFWYFRTPDNVFQIPKKRYAKEDDAFDYIIREKQPEEKRRYVSAHWDEPNVIAHIRGDVRTVDGKRVFHVAEFQSDIYSRIVELEALGPIGELKGEVAKELTNLKKLFPWGKVWHELVSKKVLEYAVKNDLDGISWDTARTQVDRWESALRKNVDEIEWSKGYSGPKQFSSQFVDIHGSKDGKRIFNQRVLAQGETTIEDQRVTLNNLIGKELATKIRESSETSGSFEGKNLTLGGEFYKIIYDQKIPGFLKRYGKKWGAIVKDRKIDVKTGYEDINLRYREGLISEHERERALEKLDLVPVPVHGMDLTPAMKEAIQTSGQALFAERTAPGKKLTVDTAKAEIAKHIGKKAVDALEKSKKVIFISRDDVAGIIGYTRESMDQGFYKNGITYLISENIDKGKAWGVLMHELGVHHGYNKIFGEKLAKEVFAAFVAENGKQTKLGKAVSKAMVRVRAAKVTRPDLINEEAVAYFCEENANIILPLHRKIIARMRLWAVKYFGVKPDIFTHDDYVALAASSMRGSIREARREPAVGDVSREVFYSQEDQREIGKFSVPEMPVEDAKEQVTDSKAFRKWFGDSKVVDEDSEPFAAYHGTRADFSEFSIEMWGTGMGGMARKGFFFTSDPLEASSYVGGTAPGGRVLPVFLSIKKPLILSYKQHGINDIIESDGDVEAYLKKSQNFISKARGIDGLILENIGGEKGHNLYVTFEPTQIKSIFNIGTFNPTKADIRYSVAEQKDLRTWADDLIKSAKDSGEILRGIKDTKGPVTKKDYVSNRETNKKIKLAAASNIRHVASEIVEGVDKYLGSISSRLGQIGPKLKAKMRKLDFDINTKYAADVKLVEPLLVKAKKMSKEDFADWDYARKNSDITKINELVVKYDMQKEYMAYRKVLARLRMEGIDVGMDIGEIEEYAPRILKDTEGFLTAIGKDPEWPLYSRFLQERATELGISVAEMPTDIKADIISNTILGGWSGLGGVPATKQRILEKIPPELNQYYMDSDAALMQHLHSMRNGIEARKFFGKIPKKVAKMRTRLHATQSKIREINELLKAKPTEEEATKLKRRRNRYVGLEKAYTAYIAEYATQRDYTQNIDSYIMELIDNKEISPHHERTVNEILTARFHEAGTRGLIQAYKNISYIDTMGSPISALTQIGDLAWAAYEGGLIRILKYVYKSTTGKARITRKDVGVERIAQEFADSGKLGKAVTMVFKVVGLEKIDAIGKESLMMAALEKYQRQAKKNPDALRKELEPIFEFETDSVIEDLLNDEISDNVKLLVYSRLLDFQPVGLSEMPQKYLDAGNGRIFYMLKTFTLKVFDVFRNEAYYKIKKGGRAEKIQGMKNLIMLSFLFVLCNAGADELKDWVLGRKTEFSDRMVDNLLRLVGVSKFVTWKARTEGVGSALARQVLPPFKFIDSLGKDIITAGDEKGLEMLGSVPVVGKLAYWHIGRGVSKREDLWDRRLRKIKVKLNKVEEDFEKAKDKDAFRRKHWEELKELQAVKTLQSELNRRRRKINKLKGAEETTTRRKTIQGLEVERTELIRTFLKGGIDLIDNGDSIWSGVLGTTAEMDKTQAEINRLVETGTLSRSKKPSRNINAGYGVKVTLSSDQYNEYVVDTNAAIKRAVDRLVSRPEWQGWTDKQRAFVIKRVINEGRKIVRDRLKITILKARLKRSK